MNDEITLLPCPFCGNSKNLSMVNEKHDHSGGYFIACPECGASTIMRYAMGDDPKPLLIEAWNRRAAVQAAQPEAVGWKRVPIEPTQEMIDAAEAINPEDHWVQLPDSEDGTRRRTRDCDSVIYYRAMLASAPTPEPMSAPTAEPVAWAIFTDAGNARMWTTFQPHVQKLADAEGLKVTPLYATPPNDSMDADRWRAFIGLDYELRAEWATNLSLAPILTQWVDNRIKFINNELSLATPPSAAAAPTTEATSSPSDAERLDAMQRHRIAVIPEYEGPWDAYVYGEDGEPSFIGSGDTPRQAIDAAIRATKGGKL